MTGGFKDYFSDASDGYARYRPTYLPQLFEWLAGVAPATGRAWDCATGSGQVALALAEHFDSIIATDASESQIVAARQHDNVAYTVARAEESGLDSASIDLVTVGQAFHWFDGDAFFAEAKRVLRRDGILAIWCYEICTVNEECDAVIDHLYSDLTGPFWAPERAMIEAGYRGVSMPGVEIESPNFEMTLEWSASDLLGYVGTWSASKRYAVHHNQDPVALVAGRLREVWGDGKRVVSWPLRVRASRANAVD